MFNPFPNDNISDWSKLKEFADDSFKFNKNGRKLSKWVENTREKEKSLVTSDFFFFPQCFQKTRTADR